MQKIKAFFRRHWTDVNVARVALVGLLMAMSFALGQYNASDAVQHAATELASANAMGFAEIVHNQGITITNEAALLSILNGRKACVVAQVPIVAPPNKLKMPVFPSQKVTP